MMPQVGERNTVIGLLAALFAAFTLVAWTRSDPATVPVLPGEAPVHALPDQAHQQVGERIRLDLGPQDEVWLAHGADGIFTKAGIHDEIVLDPDEVAAARLLSTPISLTWRHPLAGLPTAQVVRIAGVVGRGRSPERVHTFLFQDHGELPVLSVVAPQGALFDPDTGLFVVGNGIFHAPEKVLIAEARDPRWWKYPGNFHMRGKEWERRGRIQFILPDGTTGFERSVGLRVNGQMTRAFPQHALRLNFDDPLGFDLFGEDRGEGYDALILRTAGNDQIKAMMRDAFQHTLCAGLPFETTGHRTCVVYVNGAYWGVHHLRHRMDETEIERRYGIRKKHITILEDEARLYRGDTAEVVRFERLASRTAEWDGLSPEWADTLAARVDIDGFLTYMATQMILGNMDWPNQNVRFWRYTGKPMAERPLDGRWYFIMGDSDLGYGAQASPKTDMFARARAMDVPVTRLFWGMMRSPLLKVRFRTIAESLVRGPLSTDRALQELDRIADRMAPEMDRHTARWRKPADKEAWKAQVEVMRTFARERGPSVLNQLKSFAEQR